MDRINNNGNYEPENVRWVSAKDQANNTRRNRLLTFSGETRTVNEWAEKLGIHRRTITSRLDRHGWPIEKALTHPPVRVEETAP
jgi:uncharacterized protein YjcR